MGKCAACGTVIHGAVEHGIHRDGFGEGPEVDLCEDCGGSATPSCEELWANIALRRVDEAQTEVG